MSHAIAWSVYILASAGATKYTDQAISQDNAESTPAMRPRSEAKYNNGGQADVEKLKSKEIKTNKQTKTTRKKKRVHLIH